MIGLFAFDGPLYCDINNNYCNTTITNEMLERYFTVVDKLYLLIRTFHIDLTYKQANLQKLHIDDRIEVIEMPNFNSISQFFNRYKYIKRLSQVIDNCDLFFLRIPSIISNMVASLCIKKHRAYLVEVGGCAWDSYWNHGLKGKLIAPTMFFNQKYTVWNATFASYVTEKWLQKRYPTQAKTIAASNVYLSSFDTDAISRRIINMGRLNYNPVKIGTIASVDVRYKGQEYIIKAMGKLKKQGYVFEYELVGGGSGKYLKDLAKKCGVEENVHFLGLKLHDKIWSWLDSVDIYAQPSKQEGLPRALIEAMNRGCVCIGSKTAGIPELLESEFIFKNGNVKEIIDILKRIKNCKTLIGTIQRNFYKSREFSIDILSFRRKVFFEEYKDWVKSKIRYENKE